jgi:ABC-type transporter Mla subunit MlaD
MSGMTRRLAANLVWIIVFAALVTVGAFLTFVTGVLFDDSYQVRVAMPESGGVLPDQEVTVLGRAVGQVADVEVTAEGVLLTLRIHGDFEVPETAVAQVLRRSPIGEQAVELRPTETAWAAAAPDSTIETTETIVPGAGAVPARGDRRAVRAPDAGLGGHDRDRAVARARRPGRTPPDAQP